MSPALSPAPTPSPLLVGCKLPASPNLNLLIYRVSPRWLMSRVCGTAFRCARSMHLHGAQVVSNRMQKSILVAVDKWKYIAKYKTRIKRTKKLMVRSRPCTNASVPGQYAHGIGRLEHMFTRMLLGH